MEPNVPYFWVESGVEVPYGAHPTSCYPFYAYDRAHLAEYYQASQAGQDTFANEYLARYVFGPAAHDDYLSRIVGQTKREGVESWKGGEDALRGLFSVTHGGL